MGEKFLLHEVANDHNRSNETSKNYTTDIAQSYVNKRKEKEQKQKQDEKNGISKVKLSEQKWDEMKSYRYAIF